MAIYDKESMELLIKRGADVNAKQTVNGHERTLLSLANARNLKKIIKLLKDAGGK